MNSEPAMQSSPRPYQFSLRSLLILLLVVGVACAAVAQFPKWSAFAALVLLFPMVPLAVAGVAYRFIARLALKREVGTIGAASLNPIWSGLRTWWRFLGLRLAAEGPSLAKGTLAAAVYTLTVVGLWPVLREIGLTLALMLDWQLDEVVHYVYSGWWGAFSSRGYWTRLWHWELWAMGRWWLLFAALTAIWLVVSRAFAKWLQLEPVGRTISRLLAFAPWLALVELFFLIGVWIDSPVTVPEPSTGFVVGVFSWDLWHWDCWLDRGWLTRGALPTAVVGAVFFRDVLRWRWPLAILVGVGLIPIALMLSVAWTVLYQNGLPTSWAWH